MNWKSFIIAATVLLWVCQGWGYGCTIVLAGKGATADGSVLLAHNNDLPGNIASLIDVIPTREYKPGSVIRFKNGLTVPQVSRTQRMLMLYCYYGFTEGDAIAVNEHQVAIAGGVSLKADRNEQAREKDPLIKNGVSGFVRFIALERARTARECVEMIGGMYSEYGISYPSGVGVADANEVWYIEAGGGKCWVAQRIPDNSYLAAGNGYRIGTVNLKDKKNFIIPPYLKSFLTENGLWKPNKRETLNFAEIFGGRKYTEKNYYDARRVWRAQQLLTPSVKQNPGTFDHPFAMKPDKKITVKQLFGLLRDYYKGTPFEARDGERAICIFRTVHTDVLQLRGNMPPEIGAVMWAGLSSAFTTPYVPYYFGINGTPEPYRVAGPAYNEKSAFWHFRTLTNRLEERFETLVDKMIPIWEKQENKWLELQPKVEQTALQLFKTDKKQATEFLTIYSYGLAAKALETAKKMREHLETEAAVKSD